MSYNDHLNKGMIYLPLPTLQHCHVIQLTYFMLPLLKKLIFFVFPNSTAGFGNIIFCLKYFQTGRLTYISKISLIVTLKSLKDPKTY